MQARLPALLVAIASIGGCDDATAIKPQFTNAQDTLTVFALNGTPVTVPTAILLRTGNAVRIDANFLFDVAFDVNDQGEAVVYTQRAVASELVPGRRVGLQLDTRAFEAITRAPTGGFVYDSSLVVPVGRTLLIDSIDPSSCSSFSFLGQNIRAKLVIDSVAAARRTVYVRLLTNLNCGFRGLAPGLPPD
jgi:hypothetical protein